MNNIYYRFVHLVGNPDYATLPAKLRMNVIGNPGVPKTDFELYSLAVSAINGCGACVAAHDKVVRNAGVTRRGRAERGANRGRDSRRGGRARVHGGRRGHAAGSLTAPTPALTTEALGARPERSGRARRAARHGGGVQLA